jgi:predicted RNA-binding Zn-ribbon protein involved in translation (DUF1610 family)
VDLLEDAGIPPPRSPILTDEDRAELQCMALAQRQFSYVSRFFVGMVGGGALASAIGYNDEVRRIIQWVISGTGIALILSVLNVSRLASFKCPRCGELFFFGVGAPAKVFSKQCGNCGLPLVLPDEPSVDSK